MTPTILAMHGHGPGWGPGPWWPTVWLLLWGAVIAGAIWWARHRRRSRPDARGVLTERYARGDIDDDEYRHRLAVLEERAR